MNVEEFKCMYKSYHICVYHKKGETDEKIVFLHGGGLDNAMLSWEEVMEQMGNRYDMYAIDLLGYGASDKPDIEYSIPMYVEFLHEMFQTLCIDKAHLVGLSMGGGIGIGFSLRYPQMVNKLTLVDSMGFCNRMRFHAFSRWFVNSSWNVKSYKLYKSKRLIKWSIKSNLIGDKKKISDGLISEIYKLIHIPDGYRAFVSLQCYELGKKNLTTDLFSHLGELSMPVFIVNGEKDPLVTKKSAMEASKIIKNCRLHIMKGCRHWAQKERPDEFASVLTAFLDE